jgi:SPP1 gp7 family putative phage head morphogenesis protein
MAFWSRPTADEIADKIIEKASLNMPGGVKQLPAGTTTTTLTQEQARALANGNLMSPTQLLPRNPMDAVANFGPSQPLPSQPLDPLQTWGRPLPRRSEYPVAWNLQLKPQRIVPFEILKACADQCDVVRRCIDIRKQAIQEQDWDIALTATATAQLMANMGDDSLKGPGSKLIKAQALGRAQFADDIERVRGFLEEPDPINHLSWTEWLGNLLEEHFVYDALSVYPWRAYGGQVVALVILDGATIKPLLDEYGNTPQHPYPAFQQILYGYPRGEFQAAPNPDAEFLSDQLFYRPRDRRSGTPYGCSPTEKALPMADLWMKRQAWLRAEYSEGATPQLIMKADGTMSPSDRVQHEASFNDELSGDTKARHRIKVIPAGFDPVQLDEMSQKYSNDYDQFLITQIGSRFAVMPTQLGIIPQGTGGILGRGTMPGQQDISETLGDGPLEEWLIDVVNAICRLYLDMPKELTLTFTGGGIDEDAQVKATTQTTLVNGGLRTLNDIRAENGDSLYEFPEADMPFISTMQGPDFLPGSSVKPDPLGPDGNPLPPKAPPTRQADAPSRSEVQIRKTAEIGQFRTFAQKRQGKAWRPFEFTSVTPSMARALNAAGERGDALAIKVLTTETLKAEGECCNGMTASEHRHLTTDGKCCTDQPPTEDKRSPKELEGSLPKAAAPTKALPPQTQKGDELAASVVPAILSALAGGFSPIGLILAWREDSAEARSIFVATEERLLLAALRPIAEEAYEQGADITSYFLRTEVLPEPGLSDVLLELDVWIKGMASVSIDQIGDEITAGIKADETNAQIAARIEPILHDTQRAMTIARTEVARAMETASYHQAVAAQMQRKEWLTAEDDKVCSICAANEAEGDIPINDPYASGDLNAPAHPHCRCTSLWLPAS